MGQANRVKVKVLPLEVSSQIKVGSCVGLSQGTLKGDKGLEILALVGEEE